MPHIKNRIQLTDNVTAWDHTSRVHHVGDLLRLQTPISQLRATLGSLCKLSLLKQSHDTRPP